MAAAAPRMISATHSAPTNIATIKYWGKRDVKFNLPINSSVSVTMNQDDLKAITTIVASPDFEKDRLWLNGFEEDPSKNGRVQDVLREIRARAGDRATDAGEMIPAAELAGWRVHIISRNTFPTAAGLASSAAGYACLVHTLADIYAVKESYPGELSTIARMGSGSACRSLYGGFVRWDMGSAADGKDSLAIQIADEKHWPELQVLIFVVSDKKKETGSTDGMERSVKTSALLQHRAASVVPARLAAIEDAYRARDFATFGQLTMQDSNQFHACCLDTYPPVFYMNDVSRRVIGLVHAFNKEVGALKAAYTFDAGPNAVVYCLKEDAAAILAMVSSHFPAPAGEEKGWVSCGELQAQAQAILAEGKLPEKLVCGAGSAAAESGAIKHVYYTSVGDGPRVLSAAESLADDKGMPKVTAEAGAGAFSKGL